MVSVPQSLVVNLKLRPSHWLICLLSMSFLSACSPLGIINAVSKVHPADEIHAVDFGPHPRHRFDVYVPTTGVTADTPSVVFFYGGSWNSGDRRDYRFVGRRLAAAGYLTAVVDYRLYPEVQYPEFLHDSAAGVVAFQQWAKRHYPQAADKVTLIGHSAGAYNAAMLALDDTWLAREGSSPESLLNGWVGIAGPYDLYPITVEDVKPVFFHPEYPEDSNPIDFVSESSVPALLLKPEEDDLVDPIRNSVGLRDALSQANSPVTLETIAGTSHVTIIGSVSPLLFFKGSTMKPIEAFVRR